QQIEAHKAPAIQLAAAREANHSKLKSAHSIVTAFSNPLSASSSRPTTAKRSPIAAACHANQPQQQMMTA
ncbi:hypothetical protein Dimus_001756, partial [Dionaea muscipula]